MGQSQNKTMFITDATGKEKQLSNDYVLIVKEDWCSACKGLTNLLKQIPGATTSANIHLLDLKSALDQLKPSALVRQAYKANRSNVGPVPLLLRVKNGRLVNSQLGSSRDIQGLRNFMAGLKL